MKNDNIKYSTVGRLFIGAAVFVPYITWAAQTNIAVDHNVFKHSGAPNKLSLLFLSQAEKAQIKSIGNSCYLISMYKVRQNSLYFSDRPNRVVGHISTKEFTQIWDEQKVYPNTILQGSTKPNSKENYSMVLTFAQPKYNQQTAILQYRACLTDKSTEKAIPYKTLYSVSLFVDNWQGDWG